MEGMAINMLDHFLLGVSAHKCSFKDHDRVAIKSYFLDAFRAQLAELAENPASLFECSHQQQRQEQECLQDVSGVSPLVSLAPQDVPWAQMNVQSFFPDEGQLHLCQPYVFGTAGERRGKATNKEAPFALEVSSSSKDHHLASSGTTLEPAGPPDGAPSHESFVDDNNKDCPVGQLGGGDFFSMNMNFLAGG
ncbi:unnamed protein product [Amoebophrya sp. A25]|nr:unnamed protein product [Amoebophrya sp. A25]|eukprot:GSA25T00021949001.1